MNFLVTSLLNFLGLSQIQERSETESFTFVKVYTCVKDMRSHRLYTLYLLQILSDGMFKSRLLAIVVRDGSRIFFRRGCPRLLLYFSTNKPLFFFFQNTSCIRKPQVISGRGGVRTPCTLPLDLPLVISFDWKLSCMSTLNPLSPNSV